MRKYVKSPLNYIGNKYKYLDVINNIVNDNNYNKIIDVFMGSGNIIFNISGNTNQYIGNDKVKLTPDFYSFIKNNDKIIYKIDDVSKIMIQWNNFTNKDDYYRFRDYWNDKYLNSKYDLDFIYETVMLLKMASNSMVRFNSTYGYFNQGFRGIAKQKAQKDMGFFSYTMIEAMVNQLNQLKDRIIKRNIKFINKDFKELDLLSENNLLILDPPYILRKDLYQFDNYSYQDDNYLLQILQHTKSDYIYFNYLSSLDSVNYELQKFINEHNLRYILLKQKSGTGQGRSHVQKDIQEILITNIKNNYSGEIFDDI